MVSINEKKIVEACLKGKATAQRALYEQYKGVMFAVCLRYARNTADAEDMLQDAFIKVFRDLHQYKPFGPLGGWIRTIVVHTALEHLRKYKLKNQSETDKILPIDPIEKSVALEQLSANELLEKIYELPDEYRVVFNLYAIEGYAHREIAEMLDISVANSKVRLNRARNSLKATVEQSFEVRSK